MRPTPASNSWFSGTRKSPVARSMSMAFWVSWSISCGSGVVAEMSSISMVCMRL